MSDKIVEPTDIDYTNIINKFKKIDINRLMPKNNLGRTKRIKECTLDEIQEMFWNENSPFEEIINDMLRMYKNRENLCGNLLLSLRNTQNNDIIKANLIALTLMGLVYGYTEEFQNTADGLNIHAYDAVMNSLQEQLILEKQSALEERKKHRTSKIICSSNKLFFR